MSEYINDISEGSFAQQVLQSEQPVLVDFWAVWCSPCRALTPTLEKVAKKYQGNAQIAKVNVDDNQSIASQFGIKAIPTMILFDHGKEQERIVGLVSEDSITKLLDKYVASVKA